MMDLIIEYFKSFSVDKASTWLVGIFGIWLTFKKFLLKSTIDTTAKEAVDTQGTVINNLQEELERLSKVNTELAKELNKLQLQNIKLMSEMTDLHTIINKMRRQLASLGCTEQEES